jgi:hypothetical protein
VDYTRHLQFKAHGLTPSTRKTSVFQICTDSGCTADGGGDIYTGTTPSAYHVRSVASDGSEILANYDSTAGSQLAFSSNANFAALNTTAAEQNPDADFGVQQATTYGNGSVLTQTVADINNTSGTFVDPQGRSWNVSVYVDTSSITINYSGPQSGTITLSTSDVTYSSLARGTSSSSRSPLKCSETARKGAHATAMSFEAASLFLIALGLGAPFGVVVSIIGLGIGLYSYYC